MYFRDEPVATELEGSPQLGSAHIVSDDSITWIADIPGLLYNDPQEAMSKKLNAQSRNPSRLQKPNRDKDKQRPRLSTAKGKQATCDVLLLSFAWPGFGLRLRLGNREMVTLDIGLSRLTLNSDVCSPIFLEVFWPSIENRSSTMQEKCDKPDASVVLPCRCYLQNPCAKLEKVDDRVYPTL